MREVIEEYKNWIKNPKEWSEAYKSDFVRPFSDISDEKIKSEVEKIKDEFYSRNNLISTLGLSFLHFAGCDFVNNIKE